MSSVFKPSLEGYHATNFKRGRSRLTEALWLVIQWLLVSSWIAGSAHRRTVLRLFGAQIGRDVVIKPGVRVKFPWRLKIGDHSWVGENVWVDNLVEIVIGSNCCISQGAYLCTGNHDWCDPGFALITSPINVGNGVWIGAHAVVGPGVKVGEGAILGLGAVATKDLEPWTVYSVGAPAALRKRSRKTNAPIKEAKIE